MISLKEKFLSLTDDFEFEMQLMDPRMRYKYEN